MAPEGDLQTQAIGSAPEGQETQCMFCHAPLPDEGEGFVDHLDESQQCRDAYRAWLANLDLDRPGGG
jgi:hypothetical protein